MYIYIHPSNVWFGVFMLNSDVNTTGKTAVIIFDLE